MYSAMTFALKWYYDQILRLDILGVSHRMPRKNQDTVYRLQISALVPEIFKFEKWAKYANNMNDDVNTHPNIISST